MTSRISTAFALGLILSLADCATAPEPPHHALPPSPSPSVSTPGSTAPLAMAPARPTVPAVLLVRDAPPRPIVELQPVPPGKEADWVWQPGYWNWNGTKYVWQKGVWARHPAQHANWVAAKWQYRGNGWQLNEGHWE